MRRYCHGRGRCSHFELSRGERPTKTKFENNKFKPVLIFQTVAENALSVRVQRYRPPPKKTKLKTRDPVKPPSQRKRNKKHEDFRSFAVQLQFWLSEFLLISLFWFAYLTAIPQDQTTREILSSRLLRVRRPLFVLFCALCLSLRAGFARRNYIPRFAAASAF